MLVSCYVFVSNEFWGQGDILVHLPQRHGAKLSSELDECHVFGGSLEKRRRFVFHFLRFVLNVSIWRPAETHLWRSGRWSKPSTRCSIRRRNTDVLRSWRDEGNIHSETRERREMRTRIGAMSWNSLTLRWIPIMIITIEMVSDPCELDLRAANHLRRRFEMFTLEHWII